jgi:hypothetical protein
MNTYYGNYLGIVITGGEKDPEGRGRCQVFIPHIMPALYEGWNDSEQDLSFDIVGNGLSTSLNPSIIEKLQLMLPWAECAAPIVGSSPSVKDGSEVIRNRGTTRTDSGDFTPFGGTPEDNAAFSSLTNVAAQNNFRAGLCGTAVGEILEDVYGYSESDIRGGSTTGRRDGFQYNSIMQNLGWKQIQIARPEDAPPGSIISYGPVAGNSAGHVEWVGINPNGDKAYYYGLGGANGQSRPGGGSLDGFTGTAWVAPDNVTNSALAKTGQSPLNPSSVTGNVDVNQYTDPTKETNEWEGSETLKSYEDSKGKSIVKNDELYDFILNEVKTKGNFNQFGIPQGGEKYGLDGTPESWARFYTSMAFNESGFINGTVNPTDPGGGSFGIFQIATNKAVEYHAAGFGEIFNRYGISNRPYSAAEMQNPEINTRFALAISESLLSQQNIIENGQQASNGAGLSRYWAMTTFDRMSNTTQADYPEPDVVGIARSAPLIDPATPHSRNDGPDTNYQALGMFGYASEGTAVWVFFREGNPLYPVYFAASYGQREWQNMYSYSSPGIGAGVGGPIPGTEKMRLNSYGGGFESVQVTENAQAGLDPEFTFQIYGKNGSNLLFTKDHTEFNSTYNHNQRVSGDFHEITEANKQTRVRGDKKTYVEQDVFITVGNWTEEAIAASDEIQQYINEAMEIKSNVT